MTPISAHRENVAPEVDECIRDAVLAGNFREVVHRVFLAEAAEVETHAGLGQAHGTRSALDFLPAS